MCCSKSSYSNFCMNLCILVGPTFPDVVCFFFVYNSFLNFCFEIVGHDIVSVAYIYMNQQYAQNSCD